MKPKLVFMKIVGVWFVVGGMTEILALFGYEIAKPVLCTYFGAPRIACAVERVTGSLVDIVIGIGLIKRLRWARTMFLSISPVFILIGVIGIINRKTSGLSDMGVMIGLGTLVLLYGVLISYMMRKKVRMAMNENSSTR